MIGRSPDATLLSLSPPLAPWLLPPPPSGVLMTPEGRPSWGSQVLYTVVPPPAPTPQFSLVYTQPLFQPQILHAVQALAVQPLQPTSSLPIVTQPAVSQYFKEAKKKNVKPIAPKPGGVRTDAIQESYCKKRKKAEWKVKDKQQQSHPKATGVKMREQFILKPDVKQNLLESKAQAGINSEEEEELCMPRLEVQQKQKGKSSGARKLDNRDPVKPDDKPSVKLSAKRSPQPNRVVKQKEGDNVSEPDSDGGDIIATSLKRQQAEEDDSDIDLFVPVKDTDGNEEKGEAAFEKLLTGSGMPKAKRSKNPAWEESPPKKREPVQAPRRGNSGLAVATAAPWGGQAPTFDLSEDYVNDYLKDKAKTDSTKSPDPLKPPGLLMISPTTPKRASSRAVSMDVIPACLPDSVGSEIGDILRGGFLTISPPGPRTPRRRAGRGSRSGRSSPQKVEAIATKEKSIKSSSRTKSTEDLPPNLLPEDFLDEVIGQYFNADSTSEEEQTLEAEHALEGKSKPFTDSEDEEDSSTEDGEHTGSEKGARSRPPASFFSMDFLDEPAHSGKVDNHPEKVKTDIEIEKEYRHILFGGKKRKPTKISVGKKKKTPSPHKELRKRPLPEKVEKVRVVNKQKTMTVLREANGKTKQQQQTVQPLKITVKSCHSAKSPTKEKEPQQVEREVVQQLTWRGKTANSRAYDRTKMSQNTQRSRQGVSAKIEDVTGRYSKEEELAACGICEMLDPPIDPDNLNPEETTEWVGCDCLRWFHKGCTKLAKFTEKFSCKSVKMKCMEVDQEVEPEPQEESIRIAILKFCRDRDTIFIDDVML